MENIKENSILTAKEASEVFDELFQCGVKTPTVVTIDGKEEEAYYYKCTREELELHDIELLKNTEYDIPDGKEQFSHDFHKWVMLGWHIAESRKQEVGEFYPSEVEEGKKRRYERARLWEKIKKVFYQNTTPQITEEEKKIFDKAVKRGWAERYRGGYKWKFGSKASLAYFIKQVYDPKDNKQIPFKKMGQVWHETRLDSSVCKVINAKKDPKWKGEIDSFFSED